MFKLIFFLAGLALTIIFSALNLGNTGDISLGFALFKEVPVFLSTATAFLAGAVFTLPFAFYVSFGNRRKKKKETSARFTDEALPDTFAVPEPEQSPAPETPKPADEE